jgi:GT2 family glycosyltransferase
MAHALAQAARRMGLGRPRYQRFVSRVEPELLARPRVHRFAAPPIVGAADSPAEPLAVCIDPGGGGDPAVTRASLEGQAVAGVVEAPLRQALSDGRAEWMAYVRAGDRLAPRALERLGQAVALAPDAAIVTADDDLRVGGRRRAPRLRPGPSPDLWAAQDPALALFAVRREAAARAAAGGAVSAAADAAAAGGAVPAAPGAAAAVGPVSPYGLLLALGGPDGAGHAHVPLVLCHAARPVRRERPRPGAASDPGVEPTVEAIVCFRDRPELLDRCARSLLDLSTYERLALRLVDNGSTEAATSELVRRLAGDSRVSVDADPQLFNFSALNNAAASRSRAEVLVFLNSDTEIVEPGWVDGLLAQALRPEVGAVAPLLVYPDGRVQHAGAAIGLHGWAGHPFAGLRPHDETAFGTASVGPRNWLAVSAACLMVERRKLLEVGGFDERFQVGGGDVDLGLRLAAKGYRSLGVPQVRVVHDESATRDPAAIPPGDFEASHRSYGAFRTVGDPFYHPALTLRDTTCRLRVEPDEGVVR